MFFLFLTVSEYFSLLLLNCKFILSFLCIYLRSHLIPFLLHGNFNLVFFLEILHPSSFISFISLKSFFFSSLLATLQTEFFANIMTSLETLVTHNLFGNIHNCNRWPEKEPSVPITLQLSLRIEHSCHTLNLHF